MMQRVAMTGATGFIGRHLMGRLLQDGYPVNALVRKPHDHDDLRNGDVRVIEGDLNQKEALEDLVRDADVIIHLAGTAGIAKALEDPRAAFLTHAVGTLNLLEAVRLRQNRECLFIYPSSEMIHADAARETVTEEDPPTPIEPYGISKVAGELLCRGYSNAFSVPYVILRLATVYGLGQRMHIFIPSFLERLVVGEERITVGNLDVHRNYVYVDDVVEIFLLCIRLQNRVVNETFNIASETASVREVVETLVQLSETFLGKKPLVVHDPTLMRPMNVEARKYVLDSSKARNVLNWLPRYSLQAGLERTFALTLQLRGT